ncbi:MAG: outer membrane protein assembly factor BamA [Alphaproteobacteria bacterium]|nr:outer membrane protein assembly factor BamA [Rickettsiales bacterium]
MSFASKVESISTSGFKRIDKDETIARIPFCIGDDVKESDLNQAVKILYLTQYFKNISIYISNNQLQIDVVENPIVNEVAFGGITKKYSEQISEEMQLKPRSVYTRDKVKSDSERIKIIFQKVGRLNVNVVPKIEVLERNRVNVLFDIDDGSLSRVDSIFFMGTKFMPERELRRIIANRPTSKMLKMFRGKIFEEDSLDVDKSIIVQAYMNNGFPNAALNYVVAEYEKMTRNFALTYDINEGDVYHIGAVSLFTNVPEIDITNLCNNAIHINSGDLFSQREIDDTVMMISDHLSNDGYAFAKVESQIEKDDNKRIVNVKFIIQEAAIMYIGKINVLGTKRTQDYVVRRELMIREGDLYSRALIQKSKIKLHVTQFFDIVEIKEKKGILPNVVDLDVVVRDLKQTGNVSFSIGYSTFEAIILNAGVSKKNIAGLGYGGSFSAILSLWRRTLSLGFSNPHFLGTNLNLGVDLTYNNINPISTGLLPLLGNFAFKQDSVILALRLGYSLTARLFQSWSVQYRYDDVGFKDTGSSASGNLYKDQVTQRQSSMSISHTLSYDMRDNAILPSKGFFVSLTNTFGLPVPYMLHYQSNDFFGGVYVPLSKNNSWVLSITARAGAIVSYGDKDIPFQYRYALGYYNMRGFYFSGVGPHAVKEYDDGSVVQSGSIGLRGNYYYVVSTELRIPTPLPKEYGLNFVTFVDVGSAFGISGVPLNKNDSNYTGTDSNGDFTEYVVDSAMPRVAVGAGVLYMSPIGPIRLEFAAAVLKNAYDTPLVVRIHFSGTPI